MRDRGSGGERGVVRGRGRGGGRGVLGEGELVVGDQDVEHSGPP